MTAQTELSQKTEQGEWSIFSLSQDQLIQCMHCGLCLPFCPTFALTSLETDSPRGRLALMKAASDGRLEITDGFNDLINNCLGCLACQTACPAGVQYGHLLEKTRHEIEVRQREKRPLIVESLLAFLFNRLLYGPHGLERLSPFLHLYQRTGISKLNIARIISKTWGRREKMLPRIGSKTIHQALGKYVPAVPPLRGRVGFLTGCIENTILANFGIATASILSQNGYEIVIPREQVCCGALSIHLGREELAKQQARENIKAFRSVNADFVISDAAGCSAQLKEYRRILAEDPDYCDLASDFSSKVRDVTEFIANLLPLRGEPRELNLRVTYDDPCHLIHAQGIYSEPRQLIYDLPGIEFVELPEASWCCGSGGSYNLTHDAEATAILARKLDHLERVAPDVLLTANSGCYIQLAAGIKERKLDIKVMHIVELIAMVYGYELPIQVEGT